VTRKVAAQFSSGAVLVALALAGAPAAAADPTLGYGCDPPLPRIAANCPVWHTSPVTLRWSWDVNSEPAPLLGSDCASPFLIDKDTAGRDVMCAVWDVVSHKVVNEIATVRLDMTAPAVTGFAPARPPDHDGWWNHPVALAFQGADATSGVAACDTVNYSGPDGAPAQVTGACRDVAGNSAPGTFGLNYDATPPALTALKPAATNSRVSLKWATSPDAVLTEIVRSPGIGELPASRVYSGTGTNFTDPRVTNGTAYTYSISSTDAAGNSASAVQTVIPKAPLPRLHWRRVKGADYYNVQLFRGRHKILSAWPAGTHLQLREQWTFGGRRHVLAAGRYHWYVWPGFGRRSAHRYGRLITHRNLSVTTKTS
jgi:hypothetical protein